MSLRTLIFGLIGLCPLTGLSLAQSRPALPARLQVADTNQPVEAAPGIEAPALYELLRQYHTLLCPVEPQGSPYDRGALLSRPQAFVGELMTSPGRYIDTEQVRLKDAGADQPAFVWSTLVIDPGRNPIQVLSLGPRPRMPRLAGVRCVGYFYRIRLDEAAAPDRTGNLPAVQVPVLVGWVLPETSAPARPSLPAWPLQVFGAVVAAALVLFFMLFAFVRRREDWRARVVRRRRRLRNWPDETDGS